MVAERDYVIDLLFTDACMQFTLSFYYFIFGEHTGTIKVLQEIDHVAFARSNIATIFRADKSGCMFAQLYLINKLIFHRIVAKNILRYLVYGLW